MMSVHKLVESGYLKTFSYYDFEDGNRILLDINNPKSNFLRSLTSGSDVPVSRETVRSFGDFKEKFMQPIDQSIGLAFRGQAMDWPLQSSLKRFWQKFENKLPLGVPNRNETLYNAFSVNSEIVQKYLVQDGLALLPPRDQLLAIMQHYQAPTTLLDWTLDMDVALFFAYENAPVKESDHVTIYIVDIGKMHTMNHRAAPKFKNITLNSDTLLDNYDYTKHENTWTFVWPKSFGDIRFAVQRGLFAKQQFKHPDDMRPLDEFLETPQIYDDKPPLHTPLPGTLWIIKLPVSERSVVMEYLENSNITHDSIFVSWETICRDMISHYRNHLMDSTYTSVLNMSVDAAQKITNGK